MLTGLRLGNFKAFGETQNIPIKPLTLIFGANSAGKSSIIHGLLLARHASETGNLDVHQTRIGGESVNLGGFRQYVHRRDIQREVTWAATLDMSCIDDELSGRVFDYAKRSNKYPEVGSARYKSFISKLKSLGQLEFELLINLFENETDGDDLSFPCVANYCVSSNKVPILCLNRFIDGEMIPSYVDYTAPFFEDLWNLIAGVEEEITPSWASSSRQSYNIFLRKKILILDGNWTKRCRELSKAFPKGRNTLMSTKNIGIAQLRSIIGGESITEILFHSTTPIRNHQSIYKLLL